MGGSTFSISIYLVLLSLSADFSLAQVKPSKVQGCDLRFKAAIIHSKSEQIGGGLHLSTEKLAEKVRI